MKKRSRLYKPEDYPLSGKDIENTDEFGSLLEHLTNTPVSEPLYNISLTKVGVNKQKAMIYIESLDTPDTYVPVLCEISTGVDLRQNRGIHMSRCIQSIFTLAQRKFKTLDDFALALAGAVQEQQESEMAFADVSGTYIHKRYTKKTALESYDSIHLLSKATISSSNSDVLIKTGVQVYNATACPCTRTYTKYSVVPALQAMGLTIDQINQILDLTLSGTHIQRGVTTLLLDKKTSEITHKNIYQVLEQSVHLVYDLLKRPDEHDLVVRMLQKPQFTEDVAREVAYNAYRRFKDILSEKAEIYAESILFDSIHIHDVQAIIQKTLGEIKKEAE